MKTSKAGILAILDHEAVVLTPYKDVVGVWTVAVGHTASAGAPNPRHVSRLNLEEALSIFETDLAKFEKRVNAAFTVPLLIQMGRSWSLYTTEGGNHARPRHNRCQGLQPSQDDPKPTHRTIEGQARGW